MGGREPWLRPGEALRVAMPARARGVGSRIGGRVQAPHPPSPDAPETVEIKPRYPNPARFVVEGRFEGHGWIEDDSLAWWAEAASPDQDAALIADHLAAGNGQIGLHVTDLRVAVVIPEHLLAATRRQRAEEAKRKGLLGRVSASVDDWLGGDTWTGTDQITSTWEVGATRLRGWSTAMVGRSFPFIRLVRFAFRDGSVLHARRYPADVVADA